MLNYYTGRDRLNRKTKERKFSLAMPASPMIALTLHQNGAFI